MAFVVPKIQKVCGDWAPPGDKSISHRALILAALAKGPSRIKNCLRAGDVMSTLRALQALGVNIIDTNNDIMVDGVGLYGFRKPAEIIDVGNSLTTLRLLTGVLCAQPFSSVLTGDYSLLKRPMGELIVHLKKRGATLSGMNDETAPISIFPPRQNLKFIGYESPFPSAQIKSALLLSGLYAKGDTRIKETIPTRDHTERLLKQCGVFIERDRGNIQLRGGGDLRAYSLEIPGDLSSAAFLMTAALLLPGSELNIHSVGLNRTRTGIIDIARQMGGSVVSSSDSLASDELSPEPSGRIAVISSSLKGTEVSGELTIRAVDEIPLVALLATQAEGRTRISDAKVLRSKETDRLCALWVEFRKMGASISEFEDGLLIEGTTPLKGANVESYGDHRIAMTLILAGMVAKGKTEIDSIDSIQYSFPGFLESLQRLSC